MDKREVIADMVLDSVFGPTEACPEDKTFLQELGLSTGPFFRDWTCLGAVTSRDSAEDEESGAPTTIKVEVCSMPAHFWRFTIENPVDFPGEVYEVTTGSGSFRDFWPSVLHVADGMLWVRAIDEREASQDT